jgi:pimeloyl-ACP methyl ester carboxylesterase
MPDAIEPFHLAIPQAQLDGLRRRLADARWPEPETVDDWSQGAPLARVQALCARWQDGYDWRRCEAMLNGWGQHRTVLDGLGIHFLHIRSPEPGAMPMLMTHGWPGSVVEFHKVVGRLTNPVAHGDDKRDAFHLVLPSLPGYGFSDKPAAPGWGVERIARAWATLMERLGYRDWVAQGGDWGGVVTSALAAAKPAGCRAVHLNMLTIPPQPGDETSGEPDVTAAFAAMKRFNASESAYARQQATRPQTLGYGLADSPVGQAAWIYEKLHAWTDNGGAPENLFSLDEMLDNIMLYWLPNTAASSARLYWESLKDATMVRSTDLPVGVSIFPRDTTRAPRAWAERYFSRIIHWNELDRGGHFAAWEQPELFVQEVVTCFRSVR